jgi:beta-lactamase class A
MNKSIESKLLTQYPEHISVLAKFMRLYKQSLLFIVMAIATAMPAITSAAKIEDTTLQKKLAVLEASADGRIGIAAIDTANHTRLEYRAEERFPLCSTSKMMVAAAILKQSMTDNTLLQQTIPYKKDDMTSAWSPITAKNLSAGGMTIADLCGATIAYSDSTAMNLLLKKLGGPGVVTTFARSIGDNTFRLDRFEPELNSSIPGDPRDTSTPAAMANSLHNLTLGNALGTAQRAQLQEWLKANTTGNKRIRAAVPAGWIVGDKTGTSWDYGSTNDIAVIWPPHCSSLVIAIYFTGNKKDAASRDDVIVAATRIVLGELEKTDPCLKYG